MAVAAEVTPSGYRFVVFLVGLKVLGGVAPYLVLLVPGYALLTPLRTNRIALRCLLGVALGAMALFLMFWVFRSLGITFSQLDPVHTVAP